MDADKSLPQRTSPLWLEGARWPHNCPLSPAETSLAEQHTVIGINRFIARHGLCQADRELFRELVIPLAAWLLHRQSDLGRPMLVGLGGGHSLGRRILTLGLQLVLRESFSSRVCVLSMEDFSLGRTSRQILARNAHPLMINPGLPGTHDVSLLRQTIDALLAPGRRDVPLPDFDSARDERAPRPGWPHVISGHRIIILEGWCVGARAEKDADLVQPANSLEQADDGDNRWRHCINQQLADVYGPLFSRLDHWVLLQPPDWESVRRWQQTDELEPGRGAPNTNPATPFADVGCYQRLTEALLEQGPDRADVILGLNQNGEFNSLFLRDGE